MEKIEINESPMNRNQKEEITQEEHDMIGKELRATFPNMSIEYSAKSGLNTPYQTLFDDQFEKPKKKFGG